MPNSAPIPVKQSMAPITKNAARRNAVAPTCFAITKSDRQTAGVVSLSPVTNIPSPIEPICSKSGLDVKLSSIQMLTFDGITQSVNEWALDYGVYPAVILDRLARGWHVERAITKPMVTVPGQRLRGEHMPRLPKVKRRVGGQLFAHNGLKLTLTEWSAATGIGINTMRSRIKSGMPIGAVLTPGRRPRRPGVGANFPQPIGTGGGPIAQDFLEIEFSQ